MISLPERLLITGHSMIFVAAVLVLGAAIAWML